MQPMNHNNEIIHSCKDFLPLIVITTIIIALTALKAFLTDTYNLYSLLSDFMGFFFIIFGSFKALKLSNFAHAYSMYDLIAQKSIIYAYVYPFIEIFLGIAYLMRWNLTAVNWITLILMLINGVGVAIKLYHKEAITCACLGALFKIPMTYVTLLEDLIMAGMAVGMLILS